MLTATKIDFDIIIFTKCWLRTSGQPPVLLGYCSFHTNNIFSQNDGVVIYVKDTLSVSILEPSLRDGNCLVCTTGGLAIISVYHSPSYKDFNNF